MKCCRDCGNSYELHEFVSNKLSKDGKDSLCIFCNRKRVQQWRKDFPEKRTKQIQRELKSKTKLRQDLRRNYGLSIDDYENMLQTQQYSCAICGKHESKQSQRLSVDHCHTTGKVRQLLCAHCNSLLGMAKEDLDILEKAKQYLIKHATN